MNEREARAWASRCTPEELAQRGLDVLREETPLFDIEVASACNARCPFCPREAMTRPQTLMSEDTFAAVERFLPAGAEVMFAGLGEPLLNRRLPEFVERLKRRDISSCIITNGALLSDERVVALLDAGLDQVQLSLHALDPKLASELVPGVRVEAVIENLRRLVTLRPPGLRVQVNFVLGERNVHEEAQVRELAAGLGVDLFLRREHNRGGHLGAAEVPGGCGIFARVTFITVHGVVTSCVNDVGCLSAIGPVDELGWEEVVAWKRTELSAGPGFPACRGCDDGYRWALLARPS